ncbi:unnamed protein product, partial [Polarella glacialis]
AQGYGLTETMGGCITNSGVDYLKHPTSCGKPIPFLVKVVIKDPATGKVLGDGARGEICIGGPLLMKGYNNRLEDTQKAIDEEGMFHTGDVGKIEGGFIYILDRLKDIIIRGGENIDCSEVEAAIYQHPAVRECCVFGLPDERLGEVVGAAVWLQGSPNPSPAELEGHSRKLLANFKVPEGANIFIHTEELPKGPTGKIAKKDVAQKQLGALASENLSTGTALRAATAAAAIAIVTEESENHPQQQKLRGGSSLSASVTCKPEVVKYETFVEKVLKQELRRSLDEFRRDSAVVEQVQELRHNIDLLLKDNVTELETMVELGCQFYVKALVPDTSRLCIDVGLGFHLEMTLPEAQDFLVKKEELLLQGLERKKSKTASVKADIHEALHLIDLMMQVQSGKKPWLASCDESLIKSFAD